MNWKDKFPKSNRYWETENGILYNADCVELLKKFPEKSVDLVLTDPPYGLNYRSNHGAKTGNLKDYIINDKLEDYKRLIIKIRELLDYLLCDNGEAYIFCAGGGGKPVLAYAWLEYIKGKRFKVKNLLVWDKEHPGLGWDWRFQYETIFQLQTGNGLNNDTKGSTRSNILRCKNIIPQADEHPTPKPINLLMQILKAKPSNIVLDMFLGGGSTALACEKIGRRWIGIEISEKYCKIAKHKIKSEADQLKLWR